MPVYMKSGAFTENFKILVYRKNLQKEMKMKTFVLLLLLLLCFCISPLFAYLRLPSTARFPQAQAELLIEELDLTPGIAEPEEEYDVGPRLVERSLNLDINGDSEKNASLEELGHHVGYFRLQHSHAAKMFYFFFESRGSKADDPVVLWMTGGPGCSSELAVFYENGPFKITDNLTLVWNEYGWDKASNIIFVDQPTGTGFSYSTDVRDLRYDEKGVSNDMYDFLQAFFEKHPEYAKNDFFITGESYAGHYIPAVTSRVHQGNKDNEGLPINLKGFAIGNGLTDPAIQYKAHADYALEMGLIGGDDYRGINKIYPACELSIKLCEHVGGAGVCLTAGESAACGSLRFKQPGKRLSACVLAERRRQSAYCLEVLYTCVWSVNVAEVNAGVFAGQPWRGSEQWSAAIPGTKGTVTCFASYLVCTSILSSIVSLAGNINYYDIRKECNGDLCYDFSNMENYLNQASVRDALGVGSRKFVTCSHLVYKAMLTDLMRNMEVGIPTLLEDGVKLLVYAGEYDLLSNWLGSSRWVNSMDWSGSENFKKAPTKSFLVDDKEAGLITSYGPLSFLKVRDAGHMVPMDQPKAALEMLKRWTQGSITEDNSQILKTLTKMPEKSFES